MRMVIFSLILILVMLFARSGIMGKSEFTWNGFLGWFVRKFGAMRA